MILDNRKVPDIIVSRDGIGNNANAFNNNNNGSPRHAVGNGNGSPRHGNGNGSPRHVPPIGHANNGRPVVRYVNGGSPRHVNVNSSSSPIHQRISNGNNSPIHKVKSGANNNNGSPKHIKWSAEHGYEVVYPQNGSPKYVNYNHLNSNLDSPKRINGNSCSPSHRKENSSPRHNSVPTDSPQHNTGPCRIYRQNAISSHPVNNSKTRNKNLCQVSPYHVSNKNVCVESPKHISRLAYDNLLRNKQTPNEKVLQRHSYSLDSHRPRSSSQPESELRLHYSPSRIPIHKIRNNTNSNDDMFIAKDERCDSPKRNSYVRYRNVIYNSPRRKNSEPSINTCDFKNVIKDYSTCSPKRVNLRNKNQNFIKNKAVMCRQEAREMSKDSDVYSGSLDDVRRSSVDSGKWTVDSSSSSSGKWNTDSSKWNFDKYGESDPNNKWNIDIDKSEEENDQVILKERISRHQSIDGNKVFRTRRLSSWPSGSENLSSSEGNIILSNEDNSEVDCSVDDCSQSKVVLIRCKEANYLTRIYVDKEGN